MGGKRDKLLMGIIMPIENKVVNVKKNHTYICTINFVDVFGLGFFCIKMNEYCFRLALVPHL